MVCMHVLWLCIFHPEHFFFIVCLFFTANEIVFISFVRIVAHALTYVCLHNKAMNHGILLEFILSLYFFSHRPISSFPHNYLVEMRFSLGSATVFWYAISVVIALNYRRLIRCKLPFRAYVIFYTNISIFKRFFLKIISLYCHTEKYFFLQFFLLDRWYFSLFFFSKCNIFCNKRKTIWSRLFICVHNFSVIALVYVYVYGKCRPKFSMNLYCIQYTESYNKSTRMSEKNVISCNEFHIEIVIPL